MGFQQAYNFKLGFLYQMPYTKISLASFPLSCNRVSAF